MVSLVSAKPDLPMSHFLQVNLRNSLEPQAMVTSLLTSSADPLSHISTLAPMRREKARSLMRCKALCGCRCNAMNPARRRGPEVDRRMHEPCFEKCVYGAVCSSVSVDESVQAAVRNGVRLKRIVYASLTQNVNELSTPSASVRKSRDN